MKLQKPDWNEIRWWIEDKALAAITVGALALSAQVAAEAKGLVEPRAVPAIGSLIETVDCAARTKLRNDDRLSRAIEEKIGHDLPFPLDILPEAEDNTGTIPINYNRSGVTYEACDHSRVPDLTTLPDVLPFPTGR